MATYTLSHGANRGMTDVEVAYALSVPFSAGVDAVRRFLISSFELSEWYPQMLITMKWSIGALIADL